MKLLIQELRGLADGSIQPVKLNAGICFHMEELDVDWYADWRKFQGRFMGHWCVKDSGFAAACQTWEHFSGNLSFPVPDSTSPAPTGSAAYEADANIVFLATDNLWEGEYGNLRRAFALHLAEWLEGKYNEQTTSD